MIKLTKYIRDLIIVTIDFFHQPFQRFISKETFRYAATGGMNTVFDIVLYFVFYNYVFDKQVLHLGFIAMSPHIAAFVFVFPITFTTGFLLAKYVTFTRSIIRGRVQLFRYGVSVSGSVLLNYLLLKLFVDGFGFYATLSKILTTLVVILYSYLVQKHYTFCTGKKALARIEEKSVA
ncbi:MAG TPA: GtrA family protein [Prolixibacteraceae bacterium]|nr:GtrA family protein [Prolixibacteraceae bacterium]